jgi:hypothetical protein
MDSEAFGHRRPDIRAASVILTLAALASVLVGSPLAFAGTGPAHAGRESAVTADGPPPVPVSVDIRPGLCPNHIRVGSPLAVPIAILSTVSFDVDQVDPKTVRLNRDGVTAEVQPVGWTYEDVGTPVVGGLCACHKLRGDGLDDLEFFFSIEGVVDALRLGGHSGETIPLTLTGRLMTGEPIEGVDCAVMISGQWGMQEFGNEVGLLADTGFVPGGAPAAGKFRFTYYTTVSERVTFAIYDAQGRVVARLNDMDMAPGIYNATWNGRDESREEVAAGIYFARVNNSIASATRKIIVPE